MPKVARVLSALEVKRLTTPGLHAVGEVPGLCLSVSDTGARFWSLRVVIGGKRRELGLGGFPAVTLADARTRARELRDQIARGLDPAAEREAARSAIRAAALAAMTFRQCAAAYIEAQRPGWTNPKHAQQWENTIATWAHPFIGDLSVQDVTLAHVLRILEQPADPKQPDGPSLWVGKTETASRLRGRLESVLDWAKGRGYRSGDNPAAWKGNLDAQLPRPEKVAKRSHHEAVPVGEVGAFMARLSAAEGVGALALRFVILTAARSGEVRGATWDEFDLEARVWTVPAERMKAGKVHRVPLSDAALQVLAQARELPRVEGGAPLVFPAPRGGALSDMTLTAVMRRMELTAVPHGFRSTFRDWAAERTHYPREVAEMALAHTIGDKVEAAYRRGDLFDKRRRMMDDWSAFLAREETPGAVIPLQGRAAAA